MTSRTRTILVLTNDAGLGHRKAANATIQAIEKCYGDDFRLILANPIDDDSIPSPLRNLQTDYSRIVRRVPALYFLAHEWSNFRLSTVLIERLAIRNLLVPLSRILEHNQPDIIVTTHPVFVSPLVEYRHRYHETWRIAILVTDLDRLQRLWFRSEADLYLVPTKEAAELAYRHGIKRESIKVTGIPVDLRLAELTPSKKELRARFGWELNWPTFIAAGSRRTPNYLEQLKALNQAELPIQLVVVAGDAKDLLPKIQAINWRIPVHIYGYRPEFTLFLRAADAIITKAGGLTVAESLAAGIPLFITQSIPLYERGNAEYVVRNNAGIRLGSPAALIKAIRMCLEDDGRLLREMAVHAAAIGRPQAAYDAAKQIRMLWQQSAPRQSLVTDY